MRMRISLQNPRSIKHMDNLYKDLDKTFRDSLLAAGDTAIRVIRDTINNKWIGVTNYGISDGTLANSFKKRRLSISGYTGHITIGPSGKAEDYAAIHEYGNTIYPKKPGGFLAIPLERAQKFFGGDLDEHRVFKGKYLIRQATIKPKGYIAKSIPEIESQLPETFKVKYEEAWAKAQKGG